MRKNRCLRILSFLFIPYNSFSVTLDDFTDQDGSNHSLYTISGGLHQYRGLSDSSGGNYGLSPTTSFSFTGNNLTYNGTTSDLIEYGNDGAYDISANPNLKINFNSITSPDNTVLHLNLRVDTYTNSSNNHGYFSDIFVPLSNSISSFYLDLSNLSPSGYNYTSIAGTPDLSSLNGLYIYVNQDSSNVSFSISSIELDPVPEPISMLTMGAGLAAFLKNRRRKFAKK